MSDDFKKNCGINRESHQSIFLTIFIGILIVILIVKVIITIKFPDLDINKLKETFNKIISESNQINSEDQQVYTYQYPEKETQKKNGFSNRLANAILQNNIYLVKNIITNGADIMGKDTDDNEVLVYLSHTTSPEIVQYLIDSGCDVNHKNKYINTPLMYAIRADNLPAVKILIKNGANITDTTRSGRTMMSFAQSQEMKDYLSSLDGINLPDIMTRNWWRHTNLSKVQAHESELSSHIKDGTILPLAVANVSDLSIIQYLLDMGHDIFQENKNGDFPLLTAASSNTNPQMILYLISKGADVNQQSSQTGMTPLMGAAYFQKNPEIFKALLNSGADLNIKDKKGNTASNYAKQFNSYTVIKLLKP